MQHVLEHVRATAVPTDSRAADRSRRVVAARCAPMSPYGGACRRSLLSAVFPARMADARFIPRRSDGGGAGLVRLVSDLV